MDPTALLAMVPAKYATYVSAVIGLCAVVAMFLPPPKAGSSAAYSAVYSIVNKLGANAFHAANAAQKGNQ